MKFHYHNGNAFWFCPGCRFAHGVPVDGSGGSNKNWAWNGSTESPTITPSVRHFNPARDERDEAGNVIGQKPERTSCHYFITDGSIVYCDDSQDHDLRGAHPLPDFPDGYGLPGVGITT